ncbi:helix-turn-helix transcriptional regulator [Streptomyces sp. MST-110588]|uniref:helix-turn-helix domain-containing protein n=1 Tax=Streptomyces sp. MST-110588 TaxID=2833628 RepID=UPI001F5C3D7D|nr:helix-turn-helix transcriptional regulator [Streptomyces sp. MST-110588]UNO43027.1 helix-turn-helix transcriptional regulator [Streptomyces sp. MST-110588]
MGDEGREPAGLAEKLDQLFHARSRERGRPLSANDVATEINIKAGEQVISGNYIWQLRKGKRDNPTKRHIEALAEYFGVPAAYFHDQPEPADAGAVGTSERPTAVLGAMQDAGVIAMAARFMDMSEESRSAVLEMINRVRKLEGLPEVNGAGEETRSLP